MLSTCTIVVDRNKIIITCFEPITCVGIQIDYSTIHTSTLQYVRHSTQRSNNHLGINNLAICS